MLASVGRIRVANLHLLKRILRMGVPVKLALSDQLLMTEKVHNCIKVYIIYIKQHIGMPMDNMSL